MADDKTVRMVTNLDRKAIEGKLGEVRSVCGVNLLDQGQYPRAVGHR